MVRSRLAWFIPADVELPARTATARQQWLCEVLNAPEGYAWWSVLQRHTARGTRLWAEDDETRLRTVWEDVDSRRSVVNDYRTPTSRTAFPSTVVCRKQRPRVRHEWPTRLTSRR